jgi:hypothetical protein
VNVNYSTDRKRYSGQPLDLLGWTLIALAIVAGLVLALPDVSAQSTAGVASDYAASLARVTFCQPVGCVD